MLYANNSEAIIVAAEKSFIDVLIRLICEMQPKVLKEVIEKLKLSNAAAAASLLETQLLETEQRINSMPNFYEDYENKYHKLIKGEQGTDLSQGGVSF